MPLSELKQPQPPQPSRPHLGGFLIYAIFGLVIGLAIQEFRWRGSIAVPKNQVAQAERDVKAGDYKTAVAMFEKLADNNMLQGDIFYTVVLFGGFALLERNFSKLHESTSGAPSFSA